MKKIEISVKVKSKSPDSLPDWGIGKGILSTIEVEFPDKIDEIIMASRINQIYDDLVKDCVEMKINEINT